MAFYLGLSAYSFHATVCGLSVCLCVRARARADSFSCRLVVDSIQLRHCCFWALLIPDANAAASTLFFFYIPLLFK